MGKSQTLILYGTVLYNDEKNLGLSKIGPLSLFSKTATAFRYTLLQLPSLPGLTLVCLMQNNLSNVGFYEEEEVLLL